MGVIVMKEDKEKHSEESKNDTKISFIKKPKNNTN